MISIAIPVYEMNSVGLEFLNISFKKISEQTFKDFEVVISDHSKNNEIENLCNFYKKSLNVIYVRNENKRGSSSANLNNAIKNCSRDIIKILMQDEYLYDPNALKKIVNIFNNDNDVNWVLTGCVFGTEPDSIKGSMTPKYENDIVSGINKIGSPSVLTIRNSEVEFFNENLLWVMDCEYYKRLYDKFGLPYILDDKCIFVVQHKNQVTSILSEEFKTNEVKILEENFKK